jgi:MFS family permease
MLIHLLALVTFVLFLSTQIGVPALPRLSAELGANPQEMAAVLSSALMTLVALQFFSGVLADRFGRRAVLVVGAALGGLTSLLCAFVTQWQWLLALRILGGAADAIAMPALLGLTAEISEGKQGAFFGVLRSSQGLSFIAAPSIGGWLALYSLRAPFVVDGLLSFAAGAAIFVFVRGRRGEVPTPNAGGETPPLPIARVFSQRRVWAFALFSAVNNFAFPILAAFLPIKVIALGYVEWQLASLLALEAIGFTVASFVVGRFSDRVGRRPFVIVAQPLIVVACVGLFFARDLTTLIAWYTLFGLASGTTFLLGLVMMADITPGERAATTLGSFDAMIDLVIFIAPLIAISASGVIGTEWVIVLAALPALVALPIALATRETRILEQK